MFGEGLDDADTIPNQMQLMLSGVRVQNYAVSGHGTAQNFLYMKRILERTPDIGVCVVGFITDHVRRTAVPYELMAGWGLRNHLRVHRRHGQFVCLYRTGVRHVAVDCESACADWLSESLFYRKLL